MRRIIAPLAVALVAAAPSTASIPFEVRHDRLFVAASIGGKPVQALLDSGAELSVVDLATANDLALGGGRAETAKGSGGSLAGTVVEGVAIRVGGVDLPAQPVFVTDLSDIARRLNGGRPIAAVLGRPFFDRGRWTLDFRARTITPAVAKPRGVALPLVTDKGIETMPVTVEGRAARAVFDLGNGNEVLIGQAFATQLGLLSEGRPQTRATGGGLGGGVERFRVTLRSLTVGGATLRDLPVAIDPTPNAGAVNIGTRVLSRFLVTTDFPAHRLWLAAR